MLKLLIGYDGSEYAADAIDDLARAGLPATDVEATVLSIADLLPGVMREDLAHSYPAAVFKEARLRAQQELAEAQETAQHGAQRMRRVFAGWQVRAEAAADSPYWGLIKRADDRHTDLLVVGSQGRSALGRFMLGSVSQNAVLYAPCSTRIGRRRENERRETVAASAPVRIIVGWDGSPDATSAVNAIAQRAWPPGSQARLVTALDSRLVTAPPAVLPVESIAHGSPTHVHDETDLIREGARPVIQTLRNAGLDIGEPVLRRGNPKKVLTDEAETWQADCIFVGAKGMSRVEQVLLGSVSGAVAARAYCSVEVVRG
jgi:nucleotide-binding universal stress UspA family protein